MTLEFRYSVLQLWGAALFFIFVYELIRMRQVTAGRSGRALAAVGMAASFALDQLALCENKALPLWAYAALMSVLSVSAAAQLVYIVVRQRREITMMSIKESFDTLPAGLCFFRSGGMPQLVNPTMEGICLSMTGGRLSDAEHFCEMLEQGTLKESIRGGMHPIVRLEDGRAYSFLRYEHDADGEPVHELIASDITEEYRLTEELHRKQKRSAEINSRLKALNSTIRYMIMEKEILQMKVRIHDELGQALLLTKRFIGDRNGVDLEELSGIWQNCVRLLGSEKRESWQKPYFVNLQRAALLGIKVTTEGQLPEDPALIPVIDTAIAVHTTNVLRHAEGDEAHITVNGTGGFYELVFTNNGKKPKYGVKETGGLANLRREVEAAGGGMKLCALPGFELRLRLPMGEKGKEEE